MISANLRRLAAAFAIVAGLCGPASATTYSTDYTDLWWNPNESGWGVNLIQQYDTIFATLFVYGPDNSPRWYVASSLMPTGAATGLTAFTGPLYTTTGPWFGTNWSGSNPPTLVGSMTLLFNSAGTGSLSYVVNGTTVTKEIFRQTWRNNAIPGNYLGGITAIGTSCKGGVTNGPVLMFGNLTVVQNTTQVGMRIDFLDNQGRVSFCNLNGIFAGQGRLGTISQGAWSCTYGGNQFNSGTFTLTSIDAGVNGFTSTFTASDQFCVYSGKFGGLRDVL